MKLFFSLKRWARWLKFENHPKENVGFVWLAKFINKMLTNDEKHAMLIDHLWLLTKNKGGLIRESLYIV
jgi:hypothetical protein